MFLLDFVKILSKFKEKNLKKSTRKFKMLTSGVVHGRCKWSWKIQKGRMLSIQETKWCPVLQIEKITNPFYVFELLDILWVRKYPESRKVFLTFDDVFSCLKASKIFLCLFKI